MLRVMFSCLLLGLLAAGASAAPVGPIVRDMGSDFYLVQCNSDRLQPDEVVVIVRNGKEIGQGKVMRSQGAFCTVHVISGTASATDSVARPSAKPQLSDRGPEIPTQYLQTYRPNAPTAGAAQGPAASKPRVDYWNTLENGRVLNLNTGVVH